MASLSESSHDRFDLKNGVLGVQTKVCDRNSSKVEKIIFEEMEIGESYEIERLFKKYKFDEVYNLAAQSFVGTSFNSPLNTSNIPKKRSYKK